MICTITSCVGCLVIVIIITGTTFGLFVCVVLCHKKKQVNLKLVKLAHNFLSLLQNESNTAQCLSSKLYVYIMCNVLNLVLHLLCTGVLVCCGGATKKTAIPPPVLYENIDPLSQSSVQTAPSYENIPAVAFSQPQSSNIEMKECPAYGVVTRT